MVRLRIRKARGREDGTMPLFRRTDSYCVPSGATQALSHTVVTHGAYASLRRSTTSVHHMPVYKFRELNVERFLALSARYLFFAKPDVDARGRVVLEWPEQLAPAKRNSPACECARRAAST